MGGGSSSSNSSQSPVDPEAARRMAAVAERQQDMAEEQWELGRDTFQPYEEAMVESNTALIKPNQDLMKARMEEGLYDIESGRELKDTSRAARLEELKASAPAMRDYYANATADVDEQKIDPNQKSRQAGSEAAQQFSVAEGELRRSVARMGGNVGDMSTTGNMRRQAMGRAKTVTAARNTGRREGEFDAREQGRFLRNEKFGRLADAVRMRSGGLASQPTVDNTAYAQGEGQLGNYSISNPMDRSAGLYGNAIKAIGTGMNLKTDSSASSWNANI
jgi:hypothetical protein